jgi:protein-disulfide isomerase
MHDILLSHQGELRPRDVRSYAEQLGRIVEDLRRRARAPRVSEDVASADESGVSGTPTFFVNGRRHYGAYDIDTLTESVRATRGRRRQAARA